MRNPTTKRERAAVRRRLPAACRRWGIAYTARASRTLIDAVIRLALALDVPPHIIAGSDPGSNYWSATVDPGPFLFESWPATRRVRISGFGGTATFTEDELPVAFEPDSQGAMLAHLERFATGGYVESPPDLIALTGCPPFDTSLYSRYRRMFDDGEYEGAGRDDEPLGPSECGHYEVVDIRPNADMICVPLDDSQLPEEWNSLLNDDNWQDGPFLKPCEPITCEETVRPEDDR